MSSSVVTVERNGRSAVVRLRGDLAVPTVRQAFETLRGVVRRHDITRVVLDFSKAGRIDSAGIAIVALLGKQLAMQGRSLELADLAAQHRAALELLPREMPESAATPVEPPGTLERVGDTFLRAGDGVWAFGALVADTVRASVAVLARRKQLPAGALAHHIAAMGVDGVLIVGLLSFLLGMTMAFQGAVQLSRVGASVFVADMIGVSVVRELAPLMTAVILTGRTGAAIAAELGTMRVRSEIDALTTMGVDPVRFLIVPRIAAITFVGPALTLMAMFIGIGGGMLVAAAVLGLPVDVFWHRITERVTALDFAHGLGKSCVFAWIVGFTGSHLGMRAGGDAGSVGAATTRTVVVSIFAVIVVDAVFATITTLLEQT